MKKKVLILSLVFGSGLLFSQNETETKKDSTAVVNTIENQINATLERSKNWQIYKMVAKEDLLLVKKNVLDSINTYRNDIGKKEKEVSAANNKIEDLEAKITLLESQENEKSVDFNGGTLTIVLYVLIALSLVMLAYYIYKYVKANNITKQAKEELYIVNNEFNEYRAKSLEREQRLRRQLQDEINKHKNS